jgi:glycosyltransferase involved in cell wall biosynthesis
VDGRRRASRSGRRLLLVLHEPDLGGASRAVLSALPHLQALGWEVVVWVPSPGPARADLNARSTVVAGRPRLLRYGWGPLREPPGVAARLRSAPAYLAAFRGWLRSQAPDLVHANTLVTLPEALVARASGRPVLLHAHEILERGPKAAVAARLLRSAVDTVVAPSDAAAVPLRAAGLSPRVILNGVPLPELRPRRADGGPLVIGTVGTISHRKGSDVFLAAARRVGSQMPDVEFRMIGPCAGGPERAWAQHVVEAARSSGVTWGTRTDVNAELAGWDVFALPSRRDPFPLAVLEAMAAGLPVIATRVDGIPEQIPPGTGLLVESGDVEGVAAAMLELARRPDLRDALGAAARRRVETGLSVESQAQQLHEAYLATLTARAKR